MFSVEDRLQEPVRPGACWEARVGGEAVGSLLGGGRRGSSSTGQHWEGACETDAGRHQMGNEAGMGAGR